MKQQYQYIIEKAYAGFNDRDIDAVLLLMDKNVRWPNGWEGGYVEGHNGIRDYWTRQWKEINPVVKPLVFSNVGDEQMDVEVHQLVKDFNGGILFDGMIHHIYTFNNGKITGMEIKKTEI